MAKNNPAESRAIFAALADKEKLVKEPPAPKIGGRVVGKVAGPHVSKPKLASAIAAPGFGRRRFYGESWG